MNAQSKRFASLVVALGALGAGPGSAAAAWKQVPVVRHDAQVEIAAPPAAVWAHLTRGVNLITWCPAWKSRANGKVNLTKVGDVLDYTDPWGNGGRSIVTYLVARKEIRVAHEPNDGSYICQAKLTLVPSGAGTTVHYTEQYSDESPPQGPPGDCREDGSRGGRDSRGPEEGSGEKVRAKTAE